jgi:flagellar biosynthesis anti-sigma factor FlgM
MSYTTGLTPSGLRQASDPSQAESVAPASRTQTASRTAASTAAAADIATDSTKLSLAGAMLSQAATGSDVRFEKVASLRQSIEAGTYNIPSSDVASKLVDTLLK